ncbi:MAG TPA: M1 family metallopeptidase [Chloroflexi bacterium]|nr:M1 family metallopeptidase [Chloroflexota bacterium]
MEQRIFLLILTSLLLLSACGPSQKTVADLPTMQATPEAVTQTLPPPVTATPVLETSVANEEKFSLYDFQLIFDYEQHTAQVEQSITYLNKSPFTLQKILLVIPARAFPGAYLQQELTGPTVAEIQEDGIRTTLTLTDPLLTGQNLVINLRYDLDLPQREGTFGYTQRQSNLSNWYPFIPPLNAEGAWISHDPQIDLTNMLVGEYIVNEIANFNLTFVPAGSQKNIQIATGAVPTPIEGGMQYKLEKARALSFSISDQYYLEEIDHNGLLIQAYVFQNQAAKASAMLSIAAQAMDLFSDLYTAYTRDRIVLVSADFLHNMEMDGMVLLSNKIIDFYDNTPLNNLTILIPHELSHQWFYSLVGNDQALEPWLDESIASYSESLFYENYYPQHLQWWWENRVYAHEHSGYVNNSIYQAGTYENYRSSVYLNGAIFMQNLRQTVGDQVFFEGLKNYIQNYSYQIADKGLFFESFDGFNEEDFQPLLARFFR